jgi:hypothetical protein
MGNINELKGFTRGQLDAALMKIGHDVGMGTKEAIEAFLRDELVVKMSERVWKTWMTIKLGRQKSVEEIRQALKASGNNISDWANDILGKPAFTVSETEQDVELVNVSVEELGFKQSACYADICKRAFELGLDLCPAEVGPQLRLQYKDQPKGTYVVVAMNAITDSDGDLLVFSVERCDDGDRYLDAGSGNVGNIWVASNRFVFLRRKTD